MKLLGLAFLAIAVLPKGCQTPPAPPPANVASAPALKTASDTQQSKASAAVEAAAVANASAPETPAKAATAGELSVAAANLPKATPSDSAEALARTNAALSGKLEDANRAWTQARTDAATLSARVAQLEQQVTSERTAAATELQRQLAQARDDAQREANAKERVIKTWIFFGLGALLLLAAIAVIFLKAYVPQLGPQVSLWLGAGGGTLIGMGILVRAIERLIEDHPFIFWGGTLGAVLTIAAAGALVIANHHHHVTEATKP